MDKLDLIKLIRNKYLDEFLSGKLIPRIGNDQEPVATVTEFFVRKGTKTLHAICTLASSGFGEDAQILARTLFELSVTLAYIVQPASDVEKQKRARDYIFDGRRWQEKMQQTLKELKRSGKCEDWITEIENARLLSRAVEIPNDFKQPPDLRTQAESLRDPYECDYWFLYWSLSKYVHPSDLSSLAYYDKDYSTEEIRRAVIVALSWHYRIAKVAIGVFSLDDLQGELDSQVKSIINAAK